MKLPGRKWEDPGSGLFTRALSTYLWYEPILSLNLNYSILSLSLRAAYIKNGCYFMLKD